MKERSSNHRNGQAKYIQKKKQKKAKPEASIANRNKENETKEPIQQMEQF